MTKPFKARGHDNRETIQAQAVAEDPVLEERIVFLRAWLISESLDLDNYYMQRAYQDYNDRAMQERKMGNRIVRAFAPVQLHLSAVRTITPGQGVFLVLLLGLIGTMLYLHLIPTLIVALSVLTAVYLLNLTIMALGVLNVISHSPEEKIDIRVVARLGNAHWPQYTILCPLYKEVEVVPQFVNAMNALDYPTDKLQVLFLTEENDSETRNAILAMDLPPHFEVITVPDGEPRTKPRACNYGLLHATGRYTVIYDAEDVPDPLQLKKAVLTFANHDHDLVCVQAKLNFYNPTQNILTRWFSIEYAVWFNLALPALQWSKLTLPLGGTSNHFRTSVLRRMGAWDPFNVTEDCDLGLRLSQFRLRTAVLDSTTMEEANSNFKNWIRQRSRWTKGYFQTYLVHMRRPWRYLNPKKWREFFSIQLIIGASPATFFANPIMWLLLGIYLVFRPFVQGIFTTLYIAPIFYAAVICLVFGNFFLVYMMFIGCVRSRQYGLMLWVPTIPIYWVMMSVAATMAFFQLIFRPHYWEKTKHGLHLKKQEAALAKASPTPVGQQVHVR